MSDESLDQRIAALRHGMGDLLVALRDIDHVQAKRWSATTEKSLEAEAKLIVKDIERVRARIKRLERRRK